MSERRKPTRRVFRVEHRATGDGPYRPKRGGGYSHPDGYDRDRHPVPFQSRTLMAFQQRMEAKGVQAYKGWPNKDGAARFAFPSLEALERWFDETDRKALSKKGYEVREYRVPVTSSATDGVQAVFLPKDAEKLSARPLLSLRGEIRT